MNNIPGERYPGGSKSGNNRQKTENPESIEPLSISDQAPWNISEILVKFRF
jgi:hypothetical protein